MRTSAPKSRAMICAVSASSVELIVSIIRRSSSFFRTSLTLISSLSAEILDRHALGERDEFGDRRRRRRLHRHVRTLVAASRGPLRPRRPSDETAAAPPYLAAADPAGTDARAVTAADAGHRAADAPPSADEPIVPGREPAGAGAAGRVGAGADCVGRNDGPLRHRPGGGRFAGERVFNTQPPRRRHQAAGRTRGDRRGRR